MVVHRVHIALTTLLASGAFAAIAAASADHSEWPRVTRAHTHLNESSINGWTKSGSSKSDKLLGGHRDDTLDGKGGIDVIWGDYRGPGNTAHQHDVLIGGGGGDFIYGSHGRNDVDGGPGNDKIRIWFGRGKVDCGPGRDILYVSHKSDPKVKRKHCEKISHLSDRQAHF
jgi:hypothetical protein